MTAVMRREHDVFAKRTAAALLMLGAKQIEEARPTTPESMVVSAGRFELDTLAGVLVISAYGDCIYSRFEDARAGADTVGATYPSGKWNFHTWNAGLAYEQEDREGRVLALFLARLQTILPAPAPTPPSPAPLPRPEATPGTSASPPA